jgi:hypothetical protein
MSVKSVRMCKNCKWFRVDPESTLIGQCTSAIRVKFCGMNSRVLADLIWECQCFSLAQLAQSVSRDESVVDETVSKIDVRETLPSGVASQG